MALATSAPAASVWAGWLEVLVVTLAAVEVPAAASEASAVRALAVWAETKQGLPLTAESVTQAKLQGRANSPAADQLTLMTS